MSPFDPDERRAAARLQQHNPHWLILWGAYSRLYWAFPLFDTPSRTIVYAATPRELLTLMRQTELAAKPGPPPPG